MPAVNQKLFFLCSSSSSDVILLNVINIPAVMTVTALPLYTQKLALMINIILYGFQIEINLEIY